MWNFNFLSDHACSLRKGQLILCVLAAMAACPASAFSEILFKENFDELPYENGKPLPTDEKALDHGRWAAKPEDGSRALVTQDVALSEKQSLALGAESGVVANFGDAAGRPVVEPVRTRFSFCFVDAVDAETYVYTKDGTLVAYAQIAANRPDAFIRAWMDDKADEHRERISPHVWYTVEFRLPANPGPDGEYELFVWDSSQPEPTEPIARGKFYHAPQEETSYRLLTVTNQNKEQPNALYVDDYLIKTD